MRKHSVKYNHDRLVQAKRTVELVRAASVSVDKAISIASSSVGGTVFDVKLKKVDQQVMWRVKLLRDGARVKVFIDSRSGLVLEAKAEIAVAEPHDGISCEAIMSGCSTNEASPCL
jgi:uncharacterized membrane protein YkoI